MPVIPATLEVEIEVSQLEASLEKLARPYLKNKLGVMIHAYNPRRGRGTGSMAQVVYRPCLASLGP
jgi:hypothetical protein